MARRRRDRLPEVTLTVAPARRVLAVGMLAAIGALLLAVAVLQPPGAVLPLLYILGLGAAALWLANGLWQATGGSITLTEAGLYDSGGRCLCPLDNVASVERGIFAFKPAGGFIVHMKTPRPRGWAPGLWWSVGRRLGVGGVTRAGEARVMADVLAARIAMRDGT